MLHTGKFPVVFQNGWNWYLENVRSYLNMFAHNKGIQRSRCEDLPQLPVSSTVTTEGF